MKNRFFDMTGIGFSKSEDLKEPKKEDEKEGSEESDEKGKKEE